MARAIATAVAVIALGVISTRAFATMVDRVVPSHSKPWLGQLRRAADALDGARQVRADAVFIGSSSIWFGFDPLAFDATLAEHGHALTTYNFGLIPFSPAFVRSVARNVCDAQRARGSHLQLMLYEIVPDDWVADAVEHNYGDPGLIAFEHAVEVLGIKGAQIARELVRDPARAVEMTVHRVYARHEPFAVVEALKNYLYDDLQPAAWRDPPPPDEAPFVALFALFKRWVDVRGDGPAWREDARGFVPIRGEGPLALLDELMRANQGEEAFARQREWATWEGLVDFNISRDGLARSIKLMREIEHCGARVMLVVYPNSPVVVGLLSPDGRRRYIETIAEIQRATGYPVIDMRAPPELGVGDFIDGRHVSPTHGARIASQTLALHVANLLAAKP